ncbi:hypothetical protein C8R43DRAFT_1013712 [Mycena crocata]|nr:hypothetical protein C8R43DRAFT_1013712 [Mycena crocata]
MASGSSSASSSSSAGSPSPEPESRPEKKGKSKAAEKAKSAVQDKGRNEGEDPYWAYEPPKKYVRLEESADVGEFDWDALKNDNDLELWLVRIPEGVKPKYLESAQIELPAAAKTGSKSKKTTKLGVLQRKVVAYDIWSVGDDEPEELPVGGEEIKSLSCLLPRRSKRGQLYAAPVPIARTVVMAAQAVKATPDSSKATSPNTPPVYKNPPRESHPKELLTHKFMPYGSMVGTGSTEDAAGRTDTPMELDRVLVPETPATPATTSKADGKKSTGKKRKGEEGDSPKKPKKAKTAS